MVKTLRMYNKILFASFNDKIYIYIYTLYQRCKELYMICVKFGPHKSSFLSVSGTLNFYVIFKLVLDVFFILFFNLSALTGKRGRFF